MACGTCSVAFPAKTPVFFHSTALTAKAVGWKQELDLKKGKRGLGHHADRK
jgi:hypothetical protein